MIAECFESPEEERTTWLLREGGFAKSSHRDQYVNCHSRTRISKGPKGFVDHSISVAVYRLCHCNTEEVLVQKVSVDVF